MIVKSIAIILQVLTIIYLVYLLWESLTLLAFSVVSTMIVAVLALANLYFNGGVNTYHPDLSGKIVVITGANAGIGFYTTLEIARLNPKTIILACRNR